MTQQQRRQEKKGSMANEIDGFSELFPRQVSIHGWRVLSRRNDDITAHSVNIRELDCSCRDMDYNQEGAGVCDHLACVLFAADRSIDVQAALDHEMRDQMLRIDSLVRKLERRASGLEAEQAAARANGDSGGSQPSPDSWEGDPVEETKSLLRDAGWPVDQLEIWVHEDLGSVQINNNIHDDDEWEQFNDWAYEQDFLNYDRDEFINFIKAEQFPEVFG